MTRPGPARIVFGLALLVPLLVAGWFAGHRMLADIANQQARYFIDRWRTGKTQLVPARLDELQAELSSAIKLDPGNPNLHEDLARLHAWRADQGSLVDPASRAARAEARTHFTQAAILRPTSERAWSSVALMRFLLGEVDSQFGAALELALLRGPWNSEIQMMTIRIGFASWQILTPELQDQLKRAIYNQAHWKLAQQKAQLALMVKAFNRPELACLLEASGPKACPPG
jgi:hypothetical protein